MEVKGIYNKLYSYFGPQNWWPAKTPFEVIIGAILTQSTNWQNVEKAICNIENNECLSYRKISKLPLHKLAEFIRPSGYYRQKAVRLKNFTNYLNRSHQGNLKKFLSQPVVKLREELLELNGIGEETADSIILYAACKPKFVIDAYTKRLCRIFKKEFKTYNEYQQFFESQLPKRAKLFNEYHALIVAWGKLHSKKKTRDQAIKIIK